MPYTLKLTEEQAETLGYALTLAWRHVGSLADNAKGAISKTGHIERLARINDLRDLLDTCEVTEQREYN